MLTLPLAPQSPEPSQPAHFGERRRVSRKRPSAHARGARRRHRHRQRLPRLPSTAGGGGEEWRGEGRKPRRERERVRVPIAQRHQRSRGGEAQCAQTLFKPCRNGNNTRHDPVGPTAPGRAQGPARHHRPQSRHLDTSRWRILRVAARHGVGLARIVVELAHGTLDAVQFNPVQSSGSHVSEAWVRVRRNSSMEAQAEESRWRQLTCQGFSAMRARQ